MKRKIFMDISAIGISSCWWLYKKGQVEVCVYGSGQYSGCSGGCDFAVVSSGNLLIAGAYSVSGTLVHVETGRPIRDMRVSLIMPTRTRYVARSDARGRFKIIVKPVRRRRPKFRVNLDFGRMETAPEAKEIVLTGDFTRAFRRSHPELKIRYVKVSKFTGKTVRAASR
jgi:hypothetical protein